jgi:ribosomal protein L16 Arg81 hydroxylase
MRVDDDRVFLIKNAQAIPRDSYVQTSPSGRVQYLRGHAVTKQVVAGATLGVNHVDELFPEVRELSESCEEVFRIYASANLYAGWKSDNGFNIHWDTHDTLIVQAVGSKDWKVWQPTRIHPLADEPLELVPTPTTEPAWQGVLEEGDVLYMPRGWWHVAYPRNELSLHITIALRHPTGLDLVAWTMRQLRDCQELRMDVPHWAAQEERMSWLRRVRDACTRVLDDDAITAYFSSLDEAAVSRPIVRLPESATASPIAGVGDSSPLRLSRGRRLQLHLASGVGSVSFKAQGVEWRCHASLAPALALLSHVKPCTVRDMIGIVEADAERLVRPFILGLMMSDVVWADVEP